LVSSEQVASTENGGSSQQHTAEIAKRRKEEEDVLNSLCIVRKMWHEKMNVKCNS